MIAAIATASLAGSAVAGVLGEVGERIAIQFSCPRRFVWLGTVAASLALTVTLIFQSPGLWGFRIATLEKLNLAATDIGIGLLWSASSAACALTLARSWHRLHRAARQWERTIIDDTHVWIADLHGPATFGVRQPEIVVPRWLLSESSQIRDAVLAHERQHAAARDCLWRVVERVAQCTMPWNIGLLWQLQRLRSSVEIDCDSRVLRLGRMDRLTYSRALAATWQRWCRVHGADPDNAVLSLHIGRRLRTIDGSVH